MPVPEVAESFTGSVNKVTLGATKDDGGTRTSTITVGGARNVVYGGSAADAGEKPVIAMDVLDSRPDEWPEILLLAFQIEPLFWHILLHDQRPPVLYPEPLPR